jgi:hypothetical protein
LAFNAPTNFEDARTAQQMRRPFCFAMMLQSADLGAIEQI